MTSPTTDESTGAGVAAAGRSEQRPASPARTRRPRDWRMALEVIGFTAPALVLFFMFIVWPMIRAVEFSFFRWKGFGPLVDFVGLKNYVSVLTNDVFIGALQRG